MAWEFLKELFDFKEESSKPEKSKLEQERDREYINFLVARGKTKKEAYDILQKKQGKNLTDRCYIE